MRAAQPTASLVVADRRMARQAMPGAHMFAGARLWPVRDDHVRIGQGMTVGAVSLRDLGDADVEIRREPYDQLLGI